MNKIGQLILGIAILIGITAFVRHQYNYVIQKATAKHVATWGHQRKCLLCNGTGHVTSWRSHGPGVTPMSEACQSCNGTGWVDGPP